jgi:hypothetical protein
MSQDNSAKAAMRRELESCMDNRQVSDQAMITYSQEVDGAMVQLYGIGFSGLSEMAPNLVPDLSPYAAKNFVASEAAEEIGARYGLAEAGADPAMKNRNEYRAALLAFVTNSRTWSFPADGGPATMETRDGTLILDVAERKDGQRCFLCRLDGEALSDSDHAVGGVLQLDIKEAVSVMMVQLQNRRQATLELAPAAAPSGR